MLQNKKQIIRTAILLVLTAMWTICAYAQDYTYDLNGNLSKDANKQIASIHYNHLNLVDTIRYEDGRKIIYAYTASGHKLTQQVIEANGTFKQKRDYDSHFIYERDTLREIHHEDGRTIPTTPGNNTTSWEYQYHLNDHLGNVRAVLTSTPGTQTAAASFEPPTANGFLRYEDARRINAVLFDHTRTGSTHYAQRLNGSANEKYGLAKSLSVMPGDTVQLKVFAKYVDPNANNLTLALATLLTQIATGTASAGTVVDGAGYSTSSATPFPFAGLNNTSSSTGTGPKAYLNWLLFRRDFTFKSGGFVRMTTAAKESGADVAHEELASTLVISEPGYVYVYLSNEETTPLEVYFDDLSVTQTMGPVIEQTSYDPLGLTLDEFRRENAAPNNFLYNGKELQKDFDLNWYDYGARMYDAALGRWYVPDMMAEKYDSWSPYTYALNNPVTFIDPDGKDIVFSVHHRNVSKPHSRHTPLVFHDSGPPKDVRKASPAALKKLKIKPEDKSPEAALLRAFFEDYYKYNTTLGGKAEWENKNSVLRSLAARKSVDIRIVNDGENKVSEVFNSNGELVAVMISWSPKEGEDWAKETSADPQHWSQYRQLMEMAEEAYNIWRKKEIDDSRKKREMEEKRQKGQKKPHPDTTNKDQ